MEDSGEQKYVHCYEFPWSVHPRLFDDDCQELTGYKIVKIGYGNENRLGVNAADIERIQLQARAPAFSIVPQPGTPHPAQLIFLLRVIPRDNETCEQSAVHFDNFFRETLRPR